LEPGPELILLGKEFDFQNKEKRKRATKLTIANIELSFHP